jgi:hypothetical protein
VFKVHQPRKPFSKGIKGTFGSFLKIIHETPGFMDSFRSDAPKNSLVVAAEREGRGRMNPSVTAVVGNPALRLSFSFHHIRA